MSKSNLALTDEEIEQERENYAIESRKIWAKNISRARKLELSSRLKSCSERIADAQLNKVLTEIDKILDSDKVPLVSSLKGLVLSLEFIREDVDAPEKAERIIGEASKRILALIKKTIKEV